MIDLKLLYLIKHVQNGQTPLMLAAEQGSLEIIQELIRRGANVNLDDVVSVPSVALLLLLPLPLVSAVARRLKDQMPSVSMVIWSICVLSGLLVSSDLCSKGGPCGSGEGAAGEQRIY